MVEEYRKAAVVCFVSREETVGMAPMEAMACGVPVVATATGIVPLLLGETGAGTIVEPNPSSIAGALQNVLENPEERALMAKSARETIEQRYDWEHIVANYLTAYNTAIELRTRKNAK
jgi:glycosyltransferase involved in cell wall biosynthesis